MAWRDQGRLRGRARREQENAWVTCPKHGGYSPYARTLGGGMVRLDMCPQCSAEIAQEAREQANRLRASDS